METWKWGVFLIALFVFAVIVIAFLFPVQTGVTIKENTKHAVRLNVPTAEISGVGLCQFDQKLITLTVANGSMSCEFFNGTIISKDGSIWFAGRIDQSFFSGQLSNGESSTYRFKGDIRGNIAVAFIDGQAYDIVRPSGGDGIPIEMILGILLAVFGIFSVGGYLYIRKYGFKSPFSRDKHDTAYYDEKAKKYLLEKYDIQAVVDAGCHVNSGEKEEIAEGIYRMTKPDIYSGRYAHVVFKNGRVIMCDLDVDHALIKRMHEDDEYSMPEQPPDAALSRNFGAFPPYQRRRYRPRRRYPSTPYSGYGQPPY